MTWHAYLLLFFSMSEVEPIIFRIGDIVEVELSMLLVPTSNQRYKTMLKLRGIAVLDTKYTDVSAWCSTICLWILVWFVSARLLLGWRNRLVWLLSLQHAGWKGEWVITMMPRINPTRMLLWKFEYCDGPMIVFGLVDGLILFVVCRHWVLSELDSY